MLTIKSFLRPRSREFRLISLLTLLLSFTFLPRPCLSCPIECTCNSISGNFCKGLRHLPNSDVMIASSTEWHFDNGQFETISSGTFGNTLITKLSFRNGKLNKLPDGVFKNLKNLKELDLSGNQLSYVRRETFEGLENLEKLNLSRNYMWTYDPDVLKYLPSLQTLDIKSTSLACDSSTKGLKRYTEEYLVTVPEDNLCQNPEELRGLSFSQVSPREFRSHESYYPVFRISPSTRQIVFEDDELPINCSVSIGSKDTKLVWFHDNKPVFNATNKRISSSTTESQHHHLVAKFERVSETVAENRGIMTSMVVISQLKHEDTGKWECREENSQQQISRLSVDVMVLENSAIYCTKGVTHSNKGAFSWPKTVAGFSHPQYAVCPFGKSAEYSSNAGVAMATRTCGYTGRWSAVDDSACEFESQVSRELSHLAQVQITKDNYLEQLEKLVQMTESAAASMTNLEDVKFVSQVVSKVWALVNDNDINFIGVMHNKVSELLLKVVSNMLSVNEQLLERAEKMWSSCSNLIGRLQDFATLTANMADPVFGTTAPNAAMKIIRVDTMAYSNSNAHYGFSCGLGIKLSDWFNPLLTSYQQSEIQCDSPAANLSDLYRQFASKGEVLVAGIVLPKSLFKLTDDVQRFQNQFFKVHIIILRNSSLYPASSKYTDEIGFHWNPQGPVIIASAVVGDMNNLGSEILPWGQSNVQIALSSYTPASSDKQLDMWSSSKSSWQHAGCDHLRLLSTEMNLSWSNCHKLGTYVITEPGVPLYERGIYFWHFVKRVEPVVQLGSGVCVFFCFIVILTYLMFHRKLAVSSKSMHIVLNMSFSISALTSLFAWGLFTALNYPPSLIGCKLLGVSMHYFTLSTSAWMLVLCFNVSHVFRLNCNCLYSQPESFCHVSQRESIPPSSGIPESNSGSVHNMATDSHRGHQTSKPLQSLSKGIGIISESTNIVKFYVIGWGIPGVFCVMTALSSLAFYGDNQFCWIESKLVVVTLLLPAGLSSVFALGSLMRVLVSVPKTCYQNYGVKKTSAPLHSSKSSRVPGPVTECLLLPDRFPISSCAYPSQQSVNGMPVSGLNKHQHPSASSSIPYYYDASSAMVYDAASISIQADFDSFSPDSKSYTLHGAPSVHSNQSNNAMGSPLATSEIYPAQTILPCPTTNFSSNAPVAFKISSPSGNNQNKLSCTYRHRMKCHYKLRSALILFFAMTTSWGFGVMVLFYDEECHWVFSYLYAATTAFLGFFLFLNYCLLRTDVKSNYYAILCNKKQTAITAARTSHNAYQISQSASLCAERKSSLSSVESSQKASAMHHARSQKNRSKTTTPYTTSFCYSEIPAGNFHHNSHDSNHSHLSNSLMNQQVSLVHPTQQGRLISMQNSNQRAVGHVRSANMIHRGGIATSSRSGSSVRDLDLASLPEHPVPVAMGSNCVTPVIQMLASRSQTSINEAARNANSSNNSHGAQSDRESQKSQFNLGGQNTPVAAPHCVVALPPGPPPEVFKEHRPRSQKSGARIHPGISQGCHVPGSNRRHQMSTPGSVPIAAILPVCQNAPPDVIGGLNGTGNYPRGMKQKSSSKMRGNESDGSFSSSDEDSSCSFDEKQPRHVLLRSTSRSTLSSDKTESRF